MLWLTKPLLVLHSRFLKHESQSAYFITSLRTAWAIRSKKIVSRSNGLSYLFKSAVWTARAIRSKKLSAFGTVRAVPFKKIRQPFQLSVGKNKTVTSSFHWKVKCCEWSLCGNVFMSFRKYCRGMSQLRSTQLFTRASWPRPHHITINLWRQDILYHAVYWNAALLNWRNYWKIVLHVTV